MDNTRQGSKGAFSTRPSLARRVAVKRILARLVIVTEQALPMLLPVLGIAALFLAFSWFGLFRLLPDWLRLLIVFVFVFAFLASLLPFSRLRWPKSAAADRLLETRNNLANQPVGVQDDEPAFDTPFARILWQEHQNRMAEKIAALDAGLPRPDIAGYDRLALRTVPALLLVTAFGYSLSNNAGSLADGFRQHVEAATRPDLRVDAWITPPSYTGRAPVYLTGNDAAQAAAIKVPHLSDLTVRVTGGSGDEKVLFSPEGKTDTVEIAATDEAAPATKPDTDAAATPQVAAAATHTLKLTESGTLAINGRQWQFDVIPDTGPEIAFDGIPRRSANGALEIGFRGKDDYGIDSAYAEIEPVEKPAADALPLYPLPEYKLDLPRRNAREIKGLTSRNLTEHPLSGKRVRVTLVAKDASGQTGRSPPHEMILPSRTFNEGLAAAVAEERQVFALNVRDLPKAIVLNEALALRADETIPNPTHFLLIRSALSRMKQARSEEMLKDTADYLWEIALGIEDGNLSLAERKLRDAQQALAEALERNAPDAEIKKLMDELRKAMQEYMTAMAERMPNSAANQNNMAKNVLRQQDLENMMNQIENLARSGNRDAARQMLSEMQRMMNNLQAGRRPQNGQQQQDNSQMRKQIDKLGEILRDQQKLMDETFRMDQALKDRMQRGDPDTGEDGEFLDSMPQMDGEQGQQQQQQQQQPSPTDRMTEKQLRDALKQLQAQQDGLGKQLEELQKGLKELGMKPGEGFGEAGREMKGAGEALGQGEGERAVQGQGKALEALRKGAGDMMSQMQAQQQGQGQGQGQEQGQGQGGQNGRDPLGRMRRAEGPDFDNQVKVPDEIDIQRAREILDSIRRKLGDNAGPEIERRYLERLLDIR